MKDGKFYLGGIFVMVLGAVILNFFLTTTTQADTPGMNEGNRFDLIVKERVVRPKQAEPYVLLTHYIWVDRKTGIAKVFYWDPIKRGFVRYRRPVPSAKD